MVPDTFGAVVTFLLLVAPGVLWESFRKRRQPQADRSSFREISDVVLFSAGFSVAASLMVVAVSAAFAPAALDDLESFLAKGPEGSDVSPLFVGGFLVWEGVLALLLVALADVSVGERVYGRPTLFQRSLWVQLFRENVTDERAAVATVSLIDGSALRGPVAYFSVDDQLDQRELGLAAPITRFHESGGGGRQLLGAQFVMIPIGQIRDIEVVYVTTAVLDKVRRRQGMPASGSPEEPMAGESTTEAGVGNT